MPSKKRLTRLEERLQKEAQKLKSQLEKELAPKRGSGEPLQLQCWEEELSPAQISRQNKVEKEFKEIKNKLDLAIKQCGGELIHKGDLVQTYQIGQPAQPIQNAGSKGQYQLVMDNRYGLIVGTVTTPPQPPLSPKTTAPPSSPPVTAPPPPLAPTTRSSAKKMTRLNSTAISTRTRQATQQQQQQQTPPPPSPVTHHRQQQPPPQPKQIQPPIQQPPAVPQLPSTVRPTESTAVGGLATGKPAPVVDLTTDDGRPAADSREVSFNKLQGKTFPSLVVVARPHLRAKEVSAINDRPSLDGKVKSVLMHTPTKFTEWLIQQGLIRSEQTCAIHPDTKLKLGMYSDVSKFPYSGGYVWISECCPQRFVSVFSGSLFEAASHPPSVLLKLIYHWACQTNVQNIVQWVKVDNKYVKGLFTWLRAACTTALHQHVNLMGGPGKRIEVGVISLGTTSVDGNQRQVKVEVLGILDADGKQIRLRAVEPLADGDRNYKRRFSKILEPLHNWVHKDSIILTDLTVDKGCLNQLGFTHVVQSASRDSSNGNNNVMEYLRRIVPRMFQNTLSLLSRQIIQQFLDELVWREWFGPSAAQAFDHMVQHLAEQTRINVKDTLIVRLNKIATNPFKHWGFYNAGEKEVQPSTSTINSTAISTPTTVTRRGRKRMAPPPPLPPVQPEPKISKRQAAPVPVTPPLLPTPVIDLEEEQAEPSGALESYYYGTLSGKENSLMSQRVVLNIKCCVCKMSFTNNIRLLDHLLAHAHNIPPNANVVQCRFCLAMLPSKDALETHINECHPCDTFVQNSLICVICEMKFSTANQLTKHMNKEHVRAELPYECGTCHHRTSSHRAAVDHFYKEHSGTGMLQCPFCLKSISVCNGGKPYAQNVSFFMAHLQKHQKKTTAKKCNRCALWFVHKGTLKDHQLKSHLSLHGKRNLKMWPPTANSVIMAPGKDSSGGYISPIMPPVELEPETPGPLTLVIPDGMICKECEGVIQDGNHFPSVQNCPKCNFITSCARAMNHHAEICQETTPHATAAYKLVKEMHCICGYSSADGNALAKHLALCERKSAYSTADTAKAAIVTHSMLDVLGLVRKPEEPESKLPKKSEEEIDPALIHMKEEPDMIIEPETVQESENSVSELKSSLERIPEPDTIAKVETDSPVSDVEPTEESNDLSEESKTQNSTEQDKTSSEVIEGNEKSSAKDLEENDVIEMSEDNGVKSETSKEIIDKGAEENNRNKQSHKKANTESSKDSNKNISSLEELETCDGEKSKEIDVALDTDIFNKTDTKGVKYTEDTSIFDDALISKQVDSTDVPDNPNITEINESPSIKDGESNNLIESNISEKIEREKNDNLENDVNSKSEENIKTSTQSHDNKNNDDKVESDHLNSTELINNSLENELLGDIAENMDVDKDFIDTSVLNESSANPSLASKIPPETALDEPMDVDCVPNVLEFAK